MAACLATGKALQMTPEHALHVVDMMAAVKESPQTGRRIEIESALPSPARAMNNFALTVMVDPKSRSY